MNAAVQKWLGGREGIAGLLILAAVIFVAFPLIFDIFRLNLVGKYLTYAFVAVGLVLCWGYGSPLTNPALDEQVSSVTCFSTCRQR